MGTTSECCNTRTTALPVLSDRSSSTQLEGHTTHKTRKTHSPVSGRRADQEGSTTPRGTWQGWLPSNSLGVDACLWEVAAAVSTVARTRRAPSPAPSARGARALPVSGRGDVPPPVGPLHHRSPSSSPPPRIPSCAQRERTRERFMKRVYQRTHCIRVRSPPHRPLASPRWSASPL